MEYVRVVPGDRFDSLVMCILLLRASDKCVWDSDSKELTGRVWLASHILWLDWT